MTYEQYNKVLKLSDSNVRIYLDEATNAKKIYVDGDHFRDILCEMADAVDYAYRVAFDVIEVPEL